MKSIRNIPWTALQAFAAFAEDANFTRAAARLHLSQPALHAKVSNLSKALDAPLYVRKGRQIEITAAGRKVQRFAREMASAADAFQAELRGEDRTEPVVLVAGEGSYLYILGPGISAYRTYFKHPLRLETAGGAAAVDAVLAARANLGVAFLETPPAGLICHRLTRVGQVLALPARHPLASRRSISLKELRGASLIVPPSGRPHRAMVSLMLESAHVDWQVAVEASGWELMLEFVKLGVGLAIVNACCRLPKGVVARPMPELPSHQYYVFHRNGSLSKPAIELRKALMDSADRWKE